MTTSNSGNINLKEDAPGGDQDQFNIKDKRLS